MRAFSAFLVVASITNLLAGEPVRKPWGIDRRVPWTSSRIQGTPDPPTPYKLECAFPHLKFDEPLAMCAVPGTNRLAIAERHGKVYTFPNDPGTHEKRLLVDVGKTIYGLAFHPRYAQNGLVFVTSVLHPINVIPDGSRVSRFTVADPPSCRADKASELIVIQWPCGGHNGGCIRFGPDGNLYLSTGDGSGLGDELKTGQDIRDLLGSILRINVDIPGRPYGVPADNPFVGVKGARPEIYSFGHRNVWRFAFDGPTGKMWGSDIGQDLWEAVYVIRSGGNYGWSVNEGSHPFRPDRPRGPGKFVAPIIEYPHSEFRCLIGCYVYHGSRLPELDGAFLYCDFDFGTVWMLRYDGQRVTECRKLADSQFRLEAVSKAVAS